MKKIKILPNGAALHRKYGPTYRETSIFGTNLKTASEENIQTVLGLKAQDWGVRPFRFAGMRPFCGEGFLTADGSVWEHSRATLKPSFHKKNIADLTAFEHSLGQFLAHIPKDGSTIDLQSLVSSLVSSPFSMWT